MLLHMGTIKEKLILKVVLPIADKAYHTNISHWYDKVSDMISWSPEQIKIWQNANLQSLIKDAYDYTPYYHDLFTEYKIKPSDINTADDLSIIPPLTKQIILDRFDDLVSRKKGIHYKMKSTGGSTGNPTRYIKDNNSWGFDNAFNIAMWKDTGYKYGDLFLALGSSSIFPTNEKNTIHSLYYKLKGKIPFNAMNMSDERLYECSRLLIKQNIHYIYGYASSIYLLSKYIEDNGLQSQVNIKACFPTSEILTDTYRNTIERVFSCIVSDMYGAHDGGIVAHNIGNGFKVGYNCIVRTDNMESNCEAQLTDVLSSSFPFINYKLGDILEIDDGYNDFYNGQVLKNVVGRTSDIIMLENGRKLTGPGFTILFSKVKILGYRLYKSGEMELTVCIVKDKGYDENDENLIINTLHKHCGEDCNIVLKYCDHIETRANGKNLFFLNRFEQ